MDKIINGYLIKSLSNEEMADYFTRVFNNPQVKTALCNAKNMDDCSKLYGELGSIMQAYVTATGDLSDVSITKIAKTFDENRYEYFVKYAQKKQQTDGAYNFRITDPDTELYKFLPRQLFFIDHVLPQIIDEHIKRLKIERPITVDKMKEVEKSIYLSYANNRFYTHSFNGALVEKIRKEGLDINNELFAPEFAVLAKAGLNQSFKKGVLCFCELSEATFGYVPLAPEKLYMALVGADMERQANNQTLREYLTQKLERKLNGKVISPEQRKEVEVAAMKMIDFYYGQDKSAIAFAKDLDSDGKTVNVEITDATSSLDSKLYYSFCNIRSTLGGSLDKDAEMRKSLDEVAANLKSEDKDFDKLKAFVDAFNAKYPDKILLQNFYQKNFAKAITESAFNHFVNHSYADGYEVKDGKIAANELAVAVFQNPLEMYATHTIGKNKEAAAQEQGQIL